jgi:hypothetical protein
MKASRFSDAQKAFILAGRGSLPQGRDQPGDLFQLEEESKTAGSACDHLHARPRL